MLEISHFHLFAMGMLLLVLTHLMLFVPLADRSQALLIVVAVRRRRCSTRARAGWSASSTRASRGSRCAGFLALQTEPRGADPALAVGGVPGILAELSQRRGARRLSAAFALAALALRWPARAPSARSRRSATAAR